jgi:hypothetical protein
MKSAVKQGMVKQGVAGANARCRFETVAEWAHLGREAEEEEERRREQESTQVGSEQAKERRGVGEERERQRSFAPRPRLWSRFEVADLRAEFQTDFAALRMGSKKVTGRNIGTQS